MLAVREHLELDRERVEPELRRLVADALDLKFRRPIQGCYEEALEADPSLTGAVSYQVMGSHGVLKANVTVSGPETLEECALRPMANQRVLRDLGDGDDMVGFTINATF